LSCRANAFGPNRYPRKKGRSFWASFVTRFNCDYSIKVIALTVNIFFSFGGGGSVSTGFSLGGLPGYDASYPYHSCSNFFSTGHCN
jgi:hypothetical protein